jgi:hypothetical protein
MAMSDLSKGDITVIRAQWEAWFGELKGPIHGRIQTIRGMCTDELPHAEIDAALVELEELTYGLRCAIEFPVGRPTEAELERGRQLAREHGW